MSLVQQNIQSGVLDSRLLILSNVIKWDLAKDIENKNTEEVEEYDKYTYFAHLNSGEIVKIDWYADVSSIQIKKKIYEEYITPINILIVVDMQNDFITGSLGSAEAQKIVPDMQIYLSNFEGKIYFTRDTHYSNYLETLEGKYLPVTHCINGTEGHAIIDGFNIDSSKASYEVIDKGTFGFIDWKQLFRYLEPRPINEITLIGVCTDICVVSNALILRALYPNTKISVIPELCAGTSKEAHDSALKTMQSCQIEIKHLEK